MMEQLYSAANLAVMPFWLLLILLPRHSLTQKLVHVAAIPALLGLAYAILLFMGMFGDAPEGGGFSSLEALRIAFSSDKALLAGWLHYLAFDLFVGAWISRDAQRRGVNLISIIPSLGLTFMAGPFGLLLYLLQRGLQKGTWSLNEARK